MITSLTQIREDGKLITAGMTSRDMLAQGWAPSPILSLEWRSNSKRVVLDTPAGALAKLSPNYEQVALIDGSGPYSTLKIYDSDGKQTLDIPNCLIISGRNHPGTYQWFEPARDPNPNAIGAIFAVTDNGSTWQVDIDTTSGQILGVWESR